MCNCPEDNRPLVSATRKTRKRDKSKKRKKTYICVEGSIGKRWIGKSLKIQDPARCDCSEDPSMDKLLFGEDATPAYSKISRPCEDLSVDRRHVDLKCLKNDLTILRSLVTKVTAIDRSVGEKDGDGRNPEVTRSTLNISMIQSRGIDRSSAPKDQNLAIKIVREHCPLNDDANVKDEACQFISEVKESGRTNRSKRRLKDHAVKDGEEACQEFNVERCQRLCSASCGEKPSTDGVATSSTAKEIIIFKRTCHEDNQSDSKENLICPCGCDVTEKTLDQLSSCSCADVGEIYDTTSEKASKQRPSFEKPEVQSIVMGNEAVKKHCPCGCAEIVQIEGNKIPEAKDDDRLTSENTPSEYQEIEEDIEEVAKKLEEEIRSVKRKNDELKKLMKSCYCDENVDEILALQCSQLPPIRVSHSGLTTAIKVLQSKCHSKDRMITALASELRGSKNIDQIAKNLTAPCLQFTYWDFDQCSLYSFLQRPKLLSDIAKLHKTDENLVAVRPNDEISRRQLYGTPKPTNFHIIREISNCLLVSWKVPENIRGLKGYEFVINGNVAARLRNPTRTEAVLGPLNLSRSTECQRSIILALYAIDAHGQYSEPSIVKF